MGKFQGLLLVSDIDNTLLHSTGQISLKNREAISYFKSQGGLFTAATGRAVYNALPFFEGEILNAPVICCNGGQICDHRSGELLWSLTLDRDCIEVIEYVERLMPTFGCEVFSGGYVYVHRNNTYVERHLSYENFSLKEAPLHKIPIPWERVIFIQSPEETDRVSEIIAATPFRERFKFVRAWTMYYEMLHRESSKGRGLAELARMVGIPQERVIAVGDYYNDMELIQAAGLGIAVGNAVPELKQAADAVLKADSDHDTLYEVVDRLDRGEWGMLQAGERILR